MLLSRALEFGVMLELEQFPCTGDVVLSRYLTFLRLKE